MKEIWKPKEINGLIYYISNFGNVKTNRNMITTRKDKDGYLIFTAGKKKKRSVAKVHRLVAELFVPNISNKREVNHLDFDRANARFDNLEWCTHIEYTFINNNRRVNTSCENNPNAKLSNSEVIIIKNMLQSNKTVSEISKIFNVGWQTINHIKQGTTWREM